MPEDPAAIPRRRRFADACVESGTAARLLQLLLVQDGSTTRLCEAVAGGPVELRLLRQRVSSEVPAAVGRFLPGTHFIERWSSLAARGEVMMDNLAYIALDGLDRPLREGLERGEAPIGHLLQRLWTRRRFVAEADADALFARLWGASGLPDATASRAYCVDTPEGPRMLIAETFRAGMLMAPAR